MGFNGIYWDHNGILQWDYSDYSGLIWYYSDLI